MAGSVEEVASRITVHYGNRLLRYAVSPLKDSGELIIRCGIFCSNHTVGRKKCRSPLLQATSVTGIVLFQAPLFWKSVFTYSLTFGAESFHVWHLDKSLQLLRHEWRIEFKHEALREV